MFYKFDETWKLLNSSNVNIDGSYIYIDFTDDDIVKINKWYLFVDWEFVESDESILFEKTENIKKAKDLAKQGEELRSKYLSAELLPESEVKTEKLKILHDRWQEVITQYLKIEAELIEKYWVEILQDLL